jgi:hypothetical protein
MDRVQFMFSRRKRHYATDLFAQNPDVIDYVNAHSRRSPPSPRGEEARIKSWVRIAMQKPNQNDTFPQFERLPPEIRDLIWDFAILQLHRSFVLAGTLFDHQERDLNYAAHIRDVERRRGWQRQLADPALARTCRAARSRFLNASVNNPEYWTYLSKVRGVFLPHDSVFVTGPDGPLAFLKSTPQHQYPPYACRIPNLPEIILPWQGLLIAPRPADASPSRKNTRASLQMWATELREFRRNPIVTPNLKAIQVDFWGNEIEIVLRHCPISGCQCHEHGIPPDQAIPARLQKADLVSVVDLFDNARIDELLSLGQYRETYKVDGGQYFSPFQWLQWRWKNRGRDEVLLQWVALLASRAGKLKPTNLPVLDDPDSWVTWAGVNKKNQWVEGV